MSDIDDRMEAQEAEYEMGIDQKHDDARRIAELEAEVERLRTRLLSAAGDDLCRLTQEEIKAYTSENARLRTRLSAQVAAQQEYAMHFEDDVRRHFEHFGETLPKIEGPIFQAVGQWASVMRCRLTAMRKALRDAIEVADGLYQQQAMPDESQRWQAFIEAYAALEKRLDAVAALVVKWRAIPWEGDRTVGYRDCADELESILTGAEKEQTNV